MSTKTVLPIHTEAAPFVIPSYPYGRLRCVKHCWLETKPGKGTRFVGMTQNPKNDRWNKPHASTYCSLSGAMYLDENGHVQWDGVYTHDEFQKLKTFLDTYGENCTNYAEVVKATRRQEIFEEEKTNRDNPPYGSQEYRQAFIAACARYKEEGI